MLFLVVPPVGGSPLVFPTLWKKPLRMATVLMPQVMKIGAGVSRQLPDVLRSLNLCQPLLVTDSFVRKAGMMLQTENALSDSGMRFHTFCGAIPDPTTDSLVPALELMKRTPQIDCVVGFGGGSSLDSAKVLGVLSQNPGRPLRELKVPAEVPMGLPVLAIPTTAGTGSEVTRVAIVTDSESEEKMLCAGPGLLPIAALVDFELTLAKPMRLTADSGLDALCHALEAYVSRRAHPFTDSLALTALNTIFAHLRTACREPSDREAREKLMLAATQVNERVLFTLMGMPMNACPLMHAILQAGIAFSNSSVTLIHGMSRPIGAFFHVPHGLSNAMLLPSITKFSICGAPQRYAQAARAMGVAGWSASDAQATSALLDGLLSLTQDLQGWCFCLFLSKGIDRVWLGQGIAQASGWQVG